MAIRGWPERGRILDFILIAGGFVALMFGGEMLVKGAVSAATRLGVSPMVIGLTLVGFGTSTPELLTSLQAAFAGAPGIAIGNVVGSNTANVLLILAVAALIAPIAVARDAFWRDGSVMIAASLACLAVVLSGSVGRVGGGILVAALVAYLTYTLWSERRRPSPAGEVYAHEAEAVPGKPVGLGAALGLFAVGLVITLLGARFLVQGAVGIATDFGVSEAVIGVTIVAIGTSLPELVTSVIAARKGEADVALGNVIGSNIFNILGILGVTALVHPLSVPAEIAMRDIWVMLVAAGALIAVAVTGWRINRTEGGIMLALYAAYLGWLVATI